MNICSTFPEHVACQVLLNWLMWHRVIQKNKEDDILWSTVCYCYCYYFLSL